METELEKRYAAETRRVDRIILYLIIAHLPVAAFLVPLGFGTMRLGIAGALVAGLVAVPAYFLLRGHALRVVNALVLMFISYLFISCQLGRIEMHFHIFGAMAFLIMYRDWKIFPTLTLFVAAHHGIMNYCQSIDLMIPGTSIPLKVFEGDDAWLTVLLHAAFVIFEASVLIYFSHSLKQQFMAAESRNLEIDELRREGNRKVLNEVRGNSGQIIAASENLLGMAKDLSGQAQTQASSVEEISATMEEMAAHLDGIFTSTSEQASGVRDVSSRMREVEGFTAEIAADIQNTAESVRETAKAARSGGESLSILNSSIGEIVESAGKMKNIVSIINDIADRVNLLSLNASIEAARAGEAGRGFTVVAEEIAKLADQTGSSIKEISGLIETSTQQAENGMRNMEQSSAVLNRIIQDVDSINQLAENVSRAMSDQHEKNQEVTTRLRGLDERSEQMKNSAEEQKIAIREILATLERFNHSIESYANSAGRLSDIARNNDGITREFANRIETLAAS